MGIEPITFCFTEQMRYHCAKQPPFSLESNEKGGKSLRGLEPQISRLEVGRFIH